MIRPASYPQAVSLSEMPFETGADVFDTVDSKLGMTTRVIRRFRLHALPILRSSPNMVVVEDLTDLGLIGQTRTPNEALIWHDMAASVSRE